MNIKLKAPLILIAVGWLTSGIAAYSSFSSTRHIIDSAQQRELKAIALLIQTALIEQASEAEALAALVASLPAVQAAFRARDREALFQWLVPAFLKQRDQFGVLISQFHLPPASLFLNLDDVTEQPGEDQSDFREMVLMGNRHHQPQKGIELGQGGLSIRGLYPVKDAEGPIGSFEVGLSFHTVLEETKQSTGFELGVFVDDKRLTAIATHLPRHDAERLVGGFLNLEATNWQVLRSLVSADLLSGAANDVVLKLLNVGGIDYGLVMVPLQDFKEHPIGAIVATRSFEMFQSQTKRALVSTLAFAFLQMGLLTGAVLIVQNALFIRRLSALVEQTALLAQGEPATDLAELVTGRDEIGTMAQHLVALAPSSAAQAREKPADA